MQLPDTVIYASVGFVMAFLLSLLAREKVLSMITGGGFTRPNFKGHEIPLSAGVIFFLCTLPAALPLILPGTGPVRDVLQLYILAMAGATCLGLVDDFWGARDTSGLLGHFKALLRGRLTTGAVKALGGGVLGLYAGAVLYPDQPWRILDSALITALSINLLNLFDLRPGRAGKVYILLFLLLLPFMALRPELVPASLVLGALLAYLPADLKARAMMGDAGSNTLGVVTGISAAAVLDGYARVTYLAVLLLLHILTERFSLTRIIASNRLLHYLDMLGREKEPGK